MKFLIFLLVLSFSISGKTRNASVVTLTNAIYHNDEAPFISHQGPGEYDNTLAMNIEYAQIKKLRSQISDVIGQKLNFFTGFDPAGEAHITVITPVEFDKVLKSKMTMSEIELIAKMYDIQYSKFSILGIGSAKKTIEGIEHETFFVIVDSAELRNIRQQVFNKFIKLGGDPTHFDPTWFFPHITIGFTQNRDLHESNGVLKNVKFSYDHRFQLKMLPMRP